MTADSDGSSSRTKPFAATRSTPGNRQNGYLSFVVLGTPSDTACTNIPGQNPTVPRLTSIRFQAVPRSARDCHEERLSLRFLSRGSRSFADHVNAYQRQLRPLLHPSRRDPPVSRILIHSAGRRMRAPGRSGQGSAEANSAKPSVPGPLRPTRTNSPPRKPACTDRPRL
jgi:hypothetical protein